MRRLVLATALLLSAGAAWADHIGVSVTLGEPGFYGQINIGNAPPPQVVYSQPVLVQPAPESVWRRHCTCTYPRAMSGTGVSTVANTTPAAAASFSCVTTGIRTSMSRTISGSMWVNTASMSNGASTRGSTTSTSTIAPGTTRSAIPDPGAAVGVQTRRGGTTWRAPSI